MLICQRIAVREADTVPDVALGAPLDHGLDQALTDANAVIFEPAFARFNHLSLESLARLKILFLLRVKDKICTKTQFAAGRSECARHHLALLLAVADFQALLERDLGLLVQAIDVLLDLDHAVQLLVHGDDAARIGALPLHFSLLLICISLFQGLLVDHVVFSKFIFVVIEAILMIEVDMLTSQQVPLRVMLVRLVLRLKDLVRHTLLSLRVHELDIFLVWQRLAGRCTTLGGLFKDELRRRRKLAMFSVHEGVNVVHLLNLPGSSDKFDVF